MPTAAPPGEHEQILLSSNQRVVLADAFMDFTSGILSVTGINATGHIFASYPARHLSVLGGFIDQVSCGRRDPLTSALPVALPRSRAPIQAPNTPKSGKRG